MFCLFIRVDTFVLQRTKGDRRSSHDLHGSICLRIAGEPGVPEIEQWLIEELEAGQEVGADSTFLSYGMRTVPLPDWFALCYGGNCDEFLCTAVAKLTANLKTVARICSPSQVGEYFPPVDTLPPVRDNSTSRTQSVRG